MSEFDSRPVGRPIDSSPQQENQEVRSPLSRASAHDIGAAGGTPFRGRTSQLSDADWALLRTVHRFRLMSGQQVQRMYHSRSAAGGRAARRQLLRLTKAGILDRLDRRVGGVRGGSAGFIYAVGVTGQKLVSAKKRARRYREPGWQFLQHTLTITDVFVSLSEETSAHPDRRIVAFDPEPHCWRSFAANDDELHLRPDAYTVVDDSLSRSLWFIEVDLGTESRPTIRRKMNQYLAWLESGFEQRRLQSSVFPRVFWFAPDPRRRDQLQKLAESAPGPSGLHTTIGLFAQERSDPENL